MRREQAQPFPKSDFLLMLGSLFLAVVLQVATCVNEARSRLGFEAREVPLSALQRWGSVSHDRERDTTEGPRPNQGQIAQFGQFDSL